MAAPTVTISTHYESRSTYFSSPCHATLTYVARWPIEWKCTKCPEHCHWWVAEWSRHHHVGQHTCTSLNRACRSDPMPTRVLTWQAGLCILPSVNRAAEGRDRSECERRHCHTGRTCPARPSISGPIITIGPRQVAECQVRRVRVEAAMTVGLVQMRGERLPVQEASCAARARSASEVMCDVIQRGPACAGEQEGAQKRRKWVMADE